MGGCGVIPLAVCRLQAGGGMCGQWLQAGANSRRLQAGGVLCATAGGPLGLALPGTPAVGRCGGMAWL